VECVTIFNGHSNYVYCGAFLANVQRVATGGRDRTIKLWDLETGQYDLLANPGRLVAHESTVYDLASFQGNLLISGSRDGQVRVWDSRILSSVRIIDLPFFVHAVGALDNGDILAGGPAANGKKPQEGGDLAIFKFV
jgi:WD40 repeat protein